MTVCLFTVHMLFPAALAAMSSLHSKQPECTWAAGVSKGANTPKLWGAMGWLPPTCQGTTRPACHQGCGALGCGCCRGCPLQAQQGEDERVPEGAGWGEARARIDRAAAGPPSARHTARAARSRQLPRQWLSMALHRRSKLRRPQRSDPRGCNNRGSNRFSPGRAAVPGTPGILRSQGLAAPAG